MRFSRDHMACVSSSIISEFLFKGRSDSSRIYVFVRLQMLSFCIRESEVINIDTIHFKNGFFTLFLFRARKPYHHG